MCDKNEKKVQNAEQNIPVNLPLYAESTLKSYTKTELVQLIRKHQTIAEEWLKVYTNATKMYNDKYDEAIASVEKYEASLNINNVILHDTKKELKDKCKLYETIYERCGNYARTIKTLRIILCIVSIIAIILFFLVIL